MADSYADRVSIIPEGNGNRPAYPMVATSITIHETANTALGANAEMHRRFVHDGGGAEGVSFHYVVDDHESIQLLPDTENAWHAGDGREGAGNRTSIAIERCVNRDADPAEVQRRLVTLTRRLMTAHDIPVSKVYQHNHWSGKDCPMQMRHNGQWDVFLAQLRLHEPTRYFPETAQYVGGGFLTLFDRYGLEVMGYPLSGEYVDTDGYTRQDFENVQTEWREGAAARIGAGIRKLKYGS